MQIKQVTVLGQAKQYAALVQQLWPHCSKIEAIEASEQTILNGAMFVAEANQLAVGFAHTMLRYDYVEGTSTSPVGYLEGIFVANAFRQQGVAKQLLQACENWARQQGCTEFASDAELVNTTSLDVHLNLGFQKANTIVCFTKPI